MPMWFGYAPRSLVVPLLRKENDKLDELRDKVAKENTIFKDEEI